MHEVKKVERLYKKASRIISNSYAPRVKDIYFDYYEYLLHRAVPLSVQNVFNESSGYKIVFGTMDGNEKYDIPVVIAYGGRGNLIVIPITPKIKMYEKIKKKWMAPIVLTPVDYYNCPTYEEHKMLTERGQVELCTDGFIPKGSDAYLFNKDKKIFLKVREVIVSKSKKKLIQYEQQQEFIDFLRESFKEYRKENPAEEEIKLYFEMDSDFRKYVLQSCIKKLTPSFNEFLKAADLSDLRIQDMLFEVALVYGETEKQIYDEYLAPDDVWTEDAPKIRRISDCYFERLDVDGKMQFAMAALCIITLDKDMLKKGRAAFYKLWQKIPNHTRFSKLLLQTLGV